MSGGLMHILVERVLSDADSTVSEVFVDGVKVCYGLEDEYRETKVYGRTRIPAGKYKIGLRRIGDFHKRYGLRYPGMHEGMLQILDVPNFDFILIHCGNNDADTAGCLLVGEDSITTHGGMKLINSSNAYRKLYRLVIEAALADTLTIEYVDKDLDFVTRAAG
jgi:hypothetical protein